MSNQVPEWVASYIGIPFNKDGTTREEGFHCWSLVRDVVKAQWGFILPSYQEYFTDANDFEHISKQMHSAITYWTEQEREWEKVETPQLGDILFFRMRGYLWHCGITVSRDSMLHITEGINASLGRFRNPYWRPKFAGAYRHRSLF